MFNEDFQSLQTKISDSIQEFDGVDAKIGPPSFYFWTYIALNELAPEQYAVLLESLPMEPRKSVFLFLPTGSQKLIFLAMQEESRLSLITQISSLEASALLNEFDAESLLELAEKLPDRFINEAYERLDKDDKERFERASKYPADMAGHWVNFEFPTVYNSLKVSSALHLIKRNDSFLMDTLFIQDKQGHFTGEVPLPKVIVENPKTPIIDLVQYPNDVISATESMGEAVGKVIVSGRMALPVIEEDGRILGRLLLTTSYQHREELAQQQISVAGGLSEDEDLFAPVWRSSRNRAIWLGINLLTAFLASWCIGLFEATLQQVVALAILMPVVASMGGISGSQTLTVIVRALALGKITDANRRVILKKELKVGVVNGLLWAVIIGLCVHQWFGDGLLGLTIALAILVNIIVAVVSGVIIPTVLSKFKIDPALSGSVVLTTVTDIVGFVLFLGTGALILT